MRNEQYWWQDLHCPQCDSPRLVGPKGGPARKFSKDEKVPPKGWQVRYIGDEASFNNGGGHWEKIDIFCHTCYHNSDPSTRDVPRYSNRDIRDYFMAAGVLVQKKIDDESMAYKNGDTRVFEKKDGGNGELLVRWPLKEWRCPHCSKARYSGECYISGPQWTNDEDRKKYENGRTNGYGYDSYGYRSAYRKGNSSNWFQYFTDVETNLRCGNQWGKGGCGKTFKVKDMVPSFQTDTYKLSMSNSNDDEVQAQIAAMQAKYAPPSEIDNNTLTSLLAEKKAAHKGNQAKIADTPTEDAPSDLIKNKEESTTMGNKDTGVAGGIKNTCSTAGSNYVEGMKIAGSLAVAKKITTTAVTVIPGLPEVDPDSIVGTAIGMGTTSLIHGIADHNPELLNKLPLVEAEFVKAQCERAQVGYGFEGGQAVIDQLLPLLQMLTAMGKEAVTSIVSD